MPNCPSCGAAVYPQDNFCPECGQTLSEDAGAGRSNQRGQQEQATRGRQEREHGRRLPESGAKRPSGTGRGPATRGGAAPRFSKGTLTGISVVTALLAVVFLPPVFGGVSIYAGYKMYTQYDESRGQLLMGAGVVATIAGIALGAYLFTQM